MAATVDPATVNDWLKEYPNAAPAAPLPPAPAGIIQQASSLPAPPKPVTDIAPATVTTTDAKATNWDVNQNQTVQGQIKGIIAADSPLMQQAATAAKQQANARGLLNSSMAVGAGQDAVIRAALPIAQQDASTYGSAAKYNADAANAMSTFNAGAKNAASTQNAQLGMEAARANQQTALALSQQVYDAGLKTNLADIEARWRTGMQTSASMAQSFQSLTDNISRIMADPEMDAAAKQAAINNLTTLFNNSMLSQEAISGLDLGELLTFPTPAGAPPPPPPPSPYPQPEQTPYYQNPSDGA